MSSHAQTTGTFAGSLLGRFRSLLGVTCTESVDVPEDVVFEVLSNERRRRVVSHVAALKEDEVVTKSELVEAVAAEENGVPVDEITSDQRKRVLVSLHQNHLDILDAAEVLDYDGDVVRRGYAARDIASVLFKVDGTVSEGNS
jgi:hypothetical protein